MFYIVGEKSKTNLLIRFHNLIILSFFSLDVYVEKFGLFSVYVREHPCQPKSEIPVSPFLHYKNLIK